MPIAVALEQWTTAPFALEHSDFARLVATYTFAQTADSGCSSAVALAGPAPAVRRLPYWPVVARRQDCPALTAIATQGFAQTADHSATVAGHPRCFVQPL